MKLLVDSHAVLWSVDDPAKLSSTAEAALRDRSNELLISAATIWELSIKCGLGNLQLSAGFRPWMLRAVADLGAAILPITIDDADAQIALPHHHRDPFDRLLIAQSIVQLVPIVSSDPVLDQYGVRRIW